MAEVENEAKLRIQQLRCSLCPSCREKLKPTAKAAWFECENPSCAVISVHRNGQGFDVIQKVAVV